MPMAFAVLQASKRAVRLGEPKLVPRQGSFDCIAFMMVSRSAPAEQARHLSLHVDDLYPVRAIADRIAIGLAELPGALVDLIDRQVVRLFT
jgi:hypothetical protein